MRLIIFFSFAIIGIYFIERCSGQVRVRKTYGDICNETLKCEGNAWLKCQNGLCNCTNPDEMKWDTKNTRCVALAGERCSYESQGDDGIVRSRMNCIENSNCNSDGVCECSSQYYASFEGICALKKLHGLPCVNDKECDPVKNLLCSNGQCNCNSTNSVFNAIHNQCVGLAGEFAVDRKCVDNARINYAESYYVNGQYREGYRCYCESSFSVSLRKLCVKGFNDRCSASHPCDDDKEVMILCKSYNGTSEQKCQCRDSMHQYFDSSEKKCKSFVHGICQKDEQCTQNAKCNLIEKNEGRCLCKEGFIESEDGKCDLEFGAECQTRIQTHQCDRFAKLICEDKFCGCGDVNLVFDSKVRRCLSIPRSKCRNVNFNNACVENSKCKINFPIETIWGIGICECNKGYEGKGKKCAKIEPVILETTPITSIITDVKDLIITDVQNFIITDVSNEELEDV